MATTLHGGPVAVSLGRDARQNRVYKLTYRVRGEAGRDGPFAALNTPGLPQPGEAWRFGDGGGGNPGEADPWAWATGEADVKPYGVAGGEPVEWWEVECTFSSAPPDFDPSRAAGDPLAEPPDIDISFTKTSEEIWRDRFGRPVMNSAHELMRGKQVEYDSGFLVVKIGQNIPFTADALAATAAAYQCVNSLPLWGMGPRTVKLANGSLRRKFYTAPGPPPAVASYYARSLEFEVNAKGFDRLLHDEGTKALRGKWVAVAGSGGGGGVAPCAAPDGPWEYVLCPDANGKMPDPNNPRDFIRATDPYGNPARVILDGFGKPAGAVAPLGNRYVSVNLLPSTGHPVSDSEWWVPVPTFTLESFYFGGDWSAEEYYQRGDTVTTGAGTEVLGKWVALRASRDRIPDLNGDDWRELPAGMTHRGLYNPATTYAQGDRVEDSTVTSAGYVLVSWPPEVDLSALGLPASL